jgi:hypothetical protein
MKNIITEELGYMKYLLGYQRGVVISEQEIGEAPVNPPVSQKEKNAQAAYQLMIDGASGWGTDPQDIIDGLNKISYGSELNRLLTLFADKKTGYSSFTEMIKGEFSKGSDLNKIITRLNKFKSVITTPIKLNIDGDEFPVLTFKKMTKPLKDVAPAATAPAAAPAKTESTNKDNWEDVVKYYSGNTDTKWEFIKQDTFETDNYIFDYIELKPNDTNDDDAYLIIYDDGEVHYNKFGRGTGTSKGTWEWKDNKPVIKFKDISKNASGYVQPTDTDWSAVTEDNKVIGLNAKGPLVKQVQNKLIEIGYSGETGNPITTDVQACLDDVEKCDGVYGKSTKEMVKQYQKDNGLAVDGIVGQQTYYAFSEL